MMPSNTPVACRAPIELAHAAFEAGNYGDVIRHAETAIQHDPSHYYPWFVLGCGQVNYRETRQEFYNSPQTSTHHYTARDPAAPYGWSTRRDVTEFETLAVENVTTSPYQTQGYANIRRAAGQLEATLASSTATDADRANYATMLRFYGVGDTPRIWQIAQTANVREPVFYTNLAVVLKKGRHWREYARLYAIMAQRKVMDASFMRQVEVDLNAEISACQQMHGTHELRKLAWSLTIPLGAALVYAGYRIATQDGWADTWLWWWIVGTPVMLFGILAAISGAIRSWEAVGSYNAFKERLKTMGPEAPGATELRALMAGRPAPTLRGSRSP